MPETDSTGVRGEHAPSATAAPATASPSAAPSGEAPSGEAAGPADTGLIDIGEVARRTGLAPSALRFYEKKGLITAAARNGLRRAYAPDALHRLGLITCARSAGFTIAEIGAFLSAGPGDGEVRQRMAVKAQEVDETIARLTRLRDSLRHAVGCDHDPLIECPDFKRAVGRVAVPEDEGCAPEGGGQD